MANADALGIVSLIGAVIASRFISEAGLKLLSQAEKATVIDAFSGYRKYSLLVLLVVLIPAILLPGSLPRPLFFAVVCVFLLVVMVASNRELKSLGVAEAYTRRYLISQLVIAADLGSYILLSRT
jgi:hypothetical protein